LWVNQIQQYVDKHERVGLKNPVFSYDPDTYLWFVDFTRVGKDSRKAPCDEVLNTAKTMLYCFGLDKVYGKSAFSGTWEKFEKAIQLFYTHRQRPKGRRLLIPTLRGSIGYLEKDPDYRDFVPRMLELK
jgi:hypothetical protein